MCRLGLALGHNREVDQPLAIVSGSRYTGKVACDTHIKPLTCDWTRYTGCWALAGAHLMLLATHAANGLARETTVKCGKFSMNLGSKRILEGFIQD